MKQILAIIVLIGVRFGAGCQSAPEKHYPIQGEVISVDAGKKLITVKHGDIPGLMAAMTMTYQVAEPKQVETLQPGDKISADLVVSENKGRLEKIVLVSKSDEKTSSSTTRRTPEKSETAQTRATSFQRG
jgi:Cu/Ag efflux protein CusF